MEQVEALRKRRADARSQTQPAQSGHEPALSTYQKLQKQSPALKPGLATASAKRRAEEESSKAVSSLATVPGGGGLRKMGGQDGLSGGDLRAVLAKRKKM